MNYVLFVGVVIGLLAIVTVPPVMTAAVNASIQGNSSDSSSNGTNDPSVIQPGQAYVIFDQATRHINKAQSALQNGDTESANNHLELAKQSLQGNQSNSGQ